MIPGPLLAGGNASASRRQWQEMPIVLKRVS